MRAASQRCPPTRAPSRLSCDISRPEIPPCFQFRKVADYLDERSAISRPEATKCELEINAGISGFLSSLSGTVSFSTATKIVGTSRITPQPSQEARSGHLRPHHRPLRLWRFETPRYQIQSMAECNSSTSKRNVFPTNRQLSAMSSGSSSLCRSSNHPHRCRERRTAAY